MMDDRPAEIQARIDALVKVMDSRSSGVVDV
jgi:hypothetical protein